MSALERVLGSRSKVRVLEVLVREGEINITGLSRKSNVSFRTVEAIVKELRMLGIVEEKVFGRIRIIRLVREDPRVKALINLYNKFGVSKRRLR